MNCPVCGAYNVEEAKFCGTCGYSFEAQSLEPTYTSHNQPLYATSQQYYAPPAQTTVVVPQQIPAEYQPIGAWMYFLWNIIFAIPVIGFIVLVVFACGGTSNINLRNYARSFFCGMALVLILIVILMMIGLPITYLLA